MERKEKIRKSSKHKWMCANHKSFSCTNVGTHFQSQISSVCVFQYIGHLYPSPSPCLSPPISPHLPQSASLLQHCSLTGWGSVLSHQQQNCRSLSGPAIYTVVFSTRVITVSLTPSPRATGPAGHRWCDTISRDICSLSLGHISKWPIWLVTPE